MTSDRQQCYDELRAIMADNLTAFYRAHPTYLGDERSTEGIMAVSVALGQMLASLDRYEITFRRRRKD